MRCCYEYDIQSSMRKYVESKMVIHSYDIIVNVKKFKSNYEIAMYPYKKMKRNY